MSIKDTVANMAKCHADYETQLDERLAGTRPRNHREKIPMRDSPALDPARDKKDADKQYSASGKQDA